MTRRGGGHPPEQLGFGGPVRPPGEGAGGNAAVPLGARIVVMGEGGALPSTTQASERESPRPRGGAAPVLSLPSRTMRVWGVETTGGQA